MLNFEGLIVGGGTFIIIGVFHPLVIIGEYYFGLACRKWFAIAGVLLLIAALLVDNLTASSLLGVSAFSCFWSIKEVNEQVQRVKKGWFPANPKRLEKEKQAKNSTEKT